jgi:phage-related protein
MAKETEWSIVFYATAEGSEPVREFLRSLDPKTQVRFQWSIEQLRVRNVQAAEPLVKHIGGKIWELRRASSGNFYRVMYFLFTGRQIVLLHGFQKKTQKTPRSEIEIAEKRMADFIEKKGGENI